MGKMCLPVEQYTELKNFEQCIFKRFMFGAQYFYGGNSDGVVQCSKYMQK